MRRVSVMKRVMNKGPLGSMAGLTLLETMFAIALGVLVLIGAVIFFSSGKQSTGASKTVADINSIASGYQSYIATGQSLGSVTETAAPGSPTAGTTTGTYAVVQTAGYVPASLTSTIGIPYNVAYSKSDGTLKITVTGVPAKNATCSAINSMLVSAGNSTNYGAAATGDCAATVHL